MADIKDMLRIAIKSEVEAAENYGKAAEQIKIFLLKEKFKFLQKEELGHKNLLEKLFKIKFPDEEIVLPDDSEMPKQPKKKMRRQWQDISRAWRKATTICLKVNWKLHITLNYTTKSMI